MLPLGSVSSEAPSRHILVVDDEPQIPRMVAALLGTSYRVDSVDSVQAAMARLEETPFDVVLTDLSMPGESGIDLIRRVRRHDPDTPFIMLTAQASVETVVQAMREGAFDYLEKTASAEELKAAVDRATQHGQLAREVRRLRSEVEQARGLQGITGSSRVIRDLLQMAERVSASEASVLLTGETGTGKELLARTIHRLSPRRDQPFVAFDCSALSPNLIESELFGHEKGAFTGAGRSRRGLFREANDGTLFLDEIGDIAREVQNKLLRVLQEREIKPVGADRNVKINVRILAATNKDLKEAIKAGAFREDLYFRLAVVPLRLPALRERMEDLPLLCAQILAKRTSGSSQNTPTRISPTALAQLGSYSWPGNVRELENVLSRSAILCAGDEIDVGDLPPLGDGVPRAMAAVDNSRPLKQIIDSTVRMVEEQAIREALKKADGSPTRAAKQLDISRSSLYNKMKQYGIQH